MERGFFRRDPAEVAKDLVGAKLVWESKGLKGRIVETEAYYGNRDVKDPASHAFTGKTERNQVMFGPPGKTYVYVCYGIHNMLNISASQEGEPGAVLIRAIEPLEGAETMFQNRGVDSREELCSGPGKLCEAYGITKEQNDMDVTEGDLRLETGEAGEIEKDTRIGVSQGEDLELRFYESGNPHVSR
ncbi:MAG: DNA-3-methyladenine glycosylase [Candidatus Nanohaloarchaea archaeon]